MLVSGWEKTLTGNTYLKEETWVQVLSVLQDHLKRDETSLRESLWMSWTRLAGDKRRGCDSLAFLGL